MTKLAFVFPGQGSQRVGMGASLLETDGEEFGRLLERADVAAGLPIRERVMEGPIEALTQTEVAQPALFSVSLALAGVARDIGLRPDFVAGHSLGEYTAAAAAGSVSAEDGVALVSQRGRLMAEIQNERPGAMAAVIGLAVDTLSDVCERASAEGSVDLANINSPTQIVVSGEESGVVRAMALAEEAGAAKVVRLQVGAAFHSELMKPVQATLRERMAELDWSAPSAPLASNASGQLVEDADGVREALIAQIASPVRWVDCVHTLVAAGCSTFLELGPGRVLSGLIKQIEAEAEAVPADSREKLAEFAEAHPQFVGAS